VTSTGLVRYNLHEKDNVELLTKLRSLTPSQLKLIGDINQTGI